MTKFMDYMNTSWAPFCPKYSIGVCPSPTTSPKLPLRKLFISSFLHTIPWWLIPSVFYCLTCDLSYFWALSSSLFKLYHTKIGLTLSSSCFLNAKFANISCRPVHIFVDLQYVAASHENDTCCGNGLVMGSADCIKGTSRSGGRRLRMTRAKNASDSNQ